MDPDGPPTDWWIYEDLKFPYKRNIAAVGFDRDEMTLEGITREEMRRGCWDPKARLEDMDLNHVEASLCFPTFPRFCGQTFAEAHDKEVALACVRAYNDWMVEEWCGDSGGRLIPLCLIPLWDIELAVAEIRRNAARGVRAVTFSEIPTYLGLPSHPLRLLGPVLRGLPGDRDGRQHAHRLVLADARRLPGRAARRAGRRSASTTRWPR